MRLIPALEMAQTQARPVAMTDAGLVVSTHEHERVYVVLDDIYSPEGTERLIRRVADNLAPGRRFRAGRGLSGFTFLVETGPGNVVVLPVSLDDLHAETYLNPFVARVDVGADSDDVIIVGRTHCIVTQWLCTEDGE